MKDQFDILSKNRALVLKLIENLSIEQINSIPEGFNNNIGWNIAHLVVTQQLLCYKLSGLPLYISDKIVDLYRKGTVPTKDISETEFEEIKEFFAEFPNKLESDFNNGLFKSYHEYTTSVNVVLDSISKAVAFNNFHEGVHLGVILALRKLV